jgi:hypothetical protein
MPRTLARRVVSRACGAHYSGQPLGEDLPLAAGVATAKPPHHKTNPDGLALQGQISNLSFIPAVVGNPGTIAARASGRSVAADPDNERRFHPPRRYRKANTRAQAESSLVNQRVEARAFNIPAVSSRAPKLRKNRFKISATAGIAILGVGLKVYVAALPIAHAQEPQRSRMDELGSGPQPLSGKALLVWF